MEWLRRITESVWIGGLLLIAGLMIWFMSTDPGFGKVAAGKMFPAIALIGVVCGIILLFYQFWKVGMRAVQGAPFWLLLAMWLLAWAGLIGAQALLRQAGISVGFGNWHGLATVLYVLQCVFGMFYLAKT